MGVVWLVVAVLCVAAGLVLLTWDRRRRVEQPPPPATDDVEDLFTPDALPRVEDGS